MRNDKYCMSFTTGGLFHHESVNLTVLYLDSKDWNAVRAEVIAENLLQTRTLSTLKRVCREVISRLKTLDAGELDLLVASNPREQGYLLWLAVCRRYGFIAEFAVEVMRERYITFKTDLLTRTLIPFSMGNQSGMLNWTNSGQQPEKAAASAFQNTPRSRSFDGKQHD